MEQGETQNEKEIPEEIGSDISNMAATPGPKGTKRPLSISPNTEEDKAENLKQGKFIHAMSPNDSRSEKTINFQ